MNDPDRTAAPFPVDQTSSDIDKDDVDEVMPEGIIKPNANNNNNNNIEGNPPPRQF